jgi:hypothetical protein
MYRRTRMVYTCIQTSLVQVTPNPKMLGFSLDDDLLQITLISLPGSTKKGRSRPNGRSITNSSAGASKFVQAPASECVTPEVERAPVSNPDERPVHGDPAYAAIKNAQNEHAFRVSSASVIAVTQ